MFVSHPYSCSNPLTHPFHLYPSSPYPVPPCCCATADLLHTITNSSPFSPTLCLSIVCLALDVDSFCFLTISHSYTTFNKYLFYPQLKYAESATCYVKILAKSEKKIKTIPLKSKIIKRLILVNFAGCIQSILNSMMVQYLQD